MATKKVGHICQVDFQALDEMEEAVAQSIGFMELVTREYLHRYETEGTEYEKTSAYGVYQLHHVTRKRLESASDNLYTSVQKHSHAAKKAPPKKKRNG